MPAVPVGFSEAAKFLGNARQEALQSICASETYSKQTAFERLADVYNASREPNWDGEGAAAIEQDAMRNAYQFIEALPTGWPLPAITAEPDGHVSLEWYQHPRRILTVSVSPEAILYWAVLFGTEDPRGSCPFYSEIPTTILNWIARVCSK